MIEEAVAHYAPGEAPSPDELPSVLEEVAAAVDAAGIPWLLMGGMSNEMLARPRRTDDIDVFVRPVDAERTLEALGAAGFETSIHDSSWLYKAHKDGVLVDVIFRSAGDIYLDDEMIRRGRKADYHGVVVPLIPPEDLLVIKAVVAQEQSARHWYDALGIIARCDLDWDYVVGRARQSGPRRVLSLLLFAESNDLAVPADVVEELFALVHPTRRFEGERSH